MSEVQASIGGRSAAGTSTTTSQIDGAISPRCASPPLAISEPVVLAPQPTAVLPWHKRPLVRSIAIRVGIRIVTLAVIVVILRVFSREIRGAGEAYLRWIKGVGNGGGEALFWAVASLFCCISPTGYLPAIAAGATFDYHESIPISYSSVLLGSALNLLLVRGLLRNSAWLRRRCSRRAGTLVGGLEKALLAKPVRMVTLLRLPFLGNGALNYIFSLSDVPWAPQMIGNALGMAPGAVLFAVAGGQVRSLAQMIVDPASTSPTAIGVFVAVSVTVLISVAAVVATTRRVASAERLQLAKGVGAASPAVATAGTPSDGLPPLGMRNSEAGSTRGPDSESRSTTSSAEGVQLEIDP